MRQYEVAIRIAQVHHLAEEKKYKKAFAVMETLDMRQVRNISDLKVFADVYTKMGHFMEAKTTYLRIYKKSRTRRILYRLIYLAIRTGELEEAEGFYQEFLRMNPNNRDSLILRYRIDKASGVPIGQLIDILKTLKEEEYIEEWAYELAKLYHQAGRLPECREECEDILLWFGSGEIVERARLLLEHTIQKDPMPFFDDIDFTDHEKAEAHPEEDRSPVESAGLSANLSQSGTGITQDLAKEISAIYETEHREQLREKAVSVIQELPNKANEVVERMTEAVDTREYIPLRTKEIPEEEDMIAKTVVLPDLSGELPESGEEALSEEANLICALESEVETLTAATEAEPEEEKRGSDKMIEQETDFSRSDETAVQETAVTEEEPQKVPQTVPDQSVPESATGETLLEKDLPTTRALHRSFSDILILIGGELDPSHFVLMGDGMERIEGISKKIAVVMRESGFLSSGRIAHIDAEKLNQMDLMKFKTQLKGNCLLITNAAELLFPTITKVFSVMDEYYGDFAVILSDEGATLDQLFRFVPALARRFKYIIDISQYTEQDYR